MTAKHDSSSDTYKLGACIMILLISVGIFVTLLPVSSNAAFCTLMGILLVYLLKTGLTAKF
jgi:hypothetical protein